MINVIQKLKIFVLVIVLLFISSGVYSDNTTVRIKDIGKVLAARDNQLMGFGLVVGLKNTGDSSRTEFTRIALSNLLNNMDIASLNDKAFRSRNVAAVMITTDLPPFVKAGQRVDVVVSSLGDARSLEGGTLLLSPLKGADGKVYAVAQGPIAVGGINEYVENARFTRNQTTVGRISGGAIVEKEVPIDFSGEKYLRIVLDKADFPTAARVASAIQSAGLANCIAEDASTIRVELEKKHKDNIVDFISKVEKVSINPDNVAKVVVSERTGTVVIGKNVKLSPVAVSQGNISVRIESSEDNESKIKFYEKKSNLISLEPGSTLSSLVNALNAVGTSPRDLIAILQAIKKAGALSADLEII